MFLAFTSLLLFFTPRDCIVFLYLAPFFVKMSIDFSSPLAAFGRFLGKQKKIMQANKYFSL